MWQKYDFFHDRHVRKFNLFQTEDGGILEIKDFGDNGASETSSAKIRTFARQHAVSPRIKGTTDRPVVVFCSIGQCGRILIQNGFTDVPDLSVLRQPGTDGADSEMHLPEYRFQVQR